MAKSLTDGEMVNGKKHGYWVTYYANGHKRSEGRYIEGKKEGLWIQYHKNGNKASEASFRNGKNEGDYTAYYGNGNRKWGGPYRKHDGSSADGRKEGVWLCYEEDGETVWRIITYKKGAAVRNRMSIHWVSVMFAAKVDAQLGVIPVPNVGQRFLINPRKF